MDDLIDRFSILEEIDEKLNAEQWYPEDPIINQGLRIARKCIENALSVKRWIPVEDALPEYDTMVIVCYYGSDCIFPMQGETVTEAIARQNKVPTVTMGFLDEEGWNGADMFPMMIRPTFWMPLPEPPEEVQHD